MTGSKQFQDTDVLLKLLSPSASLQQQVELDLIGKARMCDVTVCICMRQIVCLKFAMLQDLLLHLDITLRQSEGVINTQRKCSFVFFYSRMHPFTLFL